MDGHNCIGLVQHYFIKIKRGRCGKLQTPLQEMWEATTPLQNGASFNKPTPMNMGKQPMCACTIEFFAESLPGPRHVNEVLRAQPIRCGHVTPRPI